MTVRRVMGTETEFGISVQGQPKANPMVASSQLVNAYATTSPRARRSRWDYEEEWPLRDARGFEVGRVEADPSQLTDEDLGVANIVLVNGARLYVDHAHPEYSTPECTNPRDVVLWDKAGDQVIVEASRLAAQVPGTAPITLYKNNTDNKGASYGSHENYLMKRSTSFAAIVRHLTPFFVSRQVVCGAGRVGVKQDGSVHAFQLSQRADFFEVEVGLETTLKRPIINTRDEPHADPHAYRRLHVIVGDANLAETSSLLKVGTTALVLDMIEAGTVDRDLRLADPVAALRAISHDPSLRLRVDLADGRKLTGLQLQREYLEMAQAHVASTTAAGEAPDAQTTEVLELWASVLDRLGTDPMLLAEELDWVAKLKLLNSYRSRDGLDWDDPKLHLIDLQYADLRPEKGLYHRLVRLGRMQRLFTDAEVDAAVHSPPRDTRAYFRGRVLAKFGEQVAAASWDSVVLDLPDRDTLQRVPTGDPFRGTAEHVEALIDRCETAGELFGALTRA